MIKTLNKVGIEGMHFNVIKVMYDKHTAKIILSGEKLKAILQKSGARQRCPLLPLLLNVEVLAREIRKEEEIKDTQIRKEEVKLSLYFDDMILYIEDPKDSTKNTIRNNKIVKLQVTKSTYKNLLCFYMLTMS